MNLWKNEAYYYVKELKKSNKKKCKDLAKSIEKIDDDLVIKLLKIYLYKCKFKHAFAYI